MSERRIKRKYDSTWITEPKGAGLICQLIATTGLASQRELLPSEYTVRYGYGIDAESELFATTVQYLGTTIGETLTFTLQP